MEAAPSAASLAAMEWEVRKVSYILALKHWSRRDLEKAMAPHSSTLAWKIPWVEEPGRLQSMGSRRVGHGWATSLSLFTFMHWRRKWHSSVLAWRIPGTGEPVGLPSMGSHRVGHDWSDLAAAGGIYITSVCRPLRMNHRAPPNCRGAEKCRGPCGIFLSCIIFTLGKNRW